MHISLQLSSALRVPAILATYTNNAMIARGFEMNPSSNHSEKTTELAVTLHQSEQLANPLHRLDTHTANTTSNAHHGAVVSSPAQIDKQAILDRLNLRLTSALQTSLDCQTILDTFYRIVGSIIDLAGVEFIPARSRRTLSLGSKAWHTLSYQLDTGKEDVGEIIYYARSRVNGIALETLESATSTIIYPMHNAARYAAAIYLAHEDALTGLGNRRALDLYLETITARAQRHGNQASVILIDIDHFKKINDTYGHNTGDKVLQRVANELSALSRDSDKVFRYGGEELVCVLDNTDFHGAKLAADRFVKSIADMDLSEVYSELEDFDESSKPFAITISAGFTELNSEESGDSAIERADHAMYEGKSQGRNKAVGIRFSTH